MRRTAILLSLACLYLAFVGATHARASSTIFDGVIEQVSVVEKGKNKGQYVLGMRAHNSPYSSVGLHAALLTDKRGKYRLETRRLDEFMTFYIDDIPVTADQIKPLLKVGTRISIFENRSFFYFLRVVTRGADNHVGYLKSIDGRMMTIERPQLGPPNMGLFMRKRGKDEAEKKVQLTYENFPHFERKIEIADDAVVKYDGKTMPWKDAELKPTPTKAPPSTADLPATGGEVNKRIQEQARESFAGRAAVMVQAPRDRMRVELLPPGFGDWKNLVNEYQARPSA
ncbi:MAG: hypothetical protein MI757_17270, partial [Pirellulales bacterium]|nr:hypothetical protein [Pirellulales bacterium]